MLLHFSLHGRRDCERSTPPRSTGTKPPSFATWRSVNSPSTKKAKKNLVNPVRLFYIFTRGEGAHARKRERERESGRGFVKARRYDSLGRRNDPGFENFDLQFLSSILNFSPPEGTGFVFLDLGRDLYLSLMLFVKIICVE